MRREGRQHGWVRTRMVLPPGDDPKPNSGHVNVLDAPPAAGVFARAPAKPTNHSKFTGRCTKPACTGCRRCPACKSSGKSKGAAKLRRLDASPGRRLGLHGASAAEVVGRLTGELEDGGEEEDAGSVEGPGGGSAAEGEVDDREFEDDGDDACDGEWFLVELDLI